MPLESRGAPAGQTLFTPATYQRLENDPKAARLIAHKHGSARIARFLAAFLLVCVSAMPAMAKRCKEKRVKAHSDMYPIPSLTESSARGNAKNAWTKRCTQLYPGVWCNLGMADKGKTVCNQVPTGAGIRPLCEFEAIPCRNS